MIVIGRIPAKKQHPTYTNAYHSKRFEELVEEFGEPHVALPKDHPFYRKPLIKVLGPGRYWRRSLPDLLIVGESLDPPDLDELKDILEARRLGEVWGKWYSDCCQQGEIGFCDFRLLEEITEESFEDHMAYIQKKITHKLITERREDGDYGRLVCNTIKGEYKMDNSSWDKTIKHSLDWERVDCKRCLHSLRFKKQKNDKFSDPEFGD